MATPCSTEASRLYSRSSAESRWHPSTVRRRKALTLRWACNCACSPRRPLSRSCRELGEDGIDWLRPAREKLPRIESRRRLLAEHALFDHDDVYALTHRCFCGTEARKAASNNQELAGQIFRRTGGGRKLRNII